MSRARCVSQTAVALSLLLLAGPAAASVASRPVIEDTKEITLTTKNDDLGAHPILKWKKVRGATTYIVVVQTPKGAPYWTWQGAETRVRFGGGPLDAPEETEGASLTSKKMWFVIAEDADGSIIASSDKRDIAP